MNFDERVKLSPFAGETTYKNDYRVPPLEPYVKYRWPCDRKERQDLPPPRPQEYTCPETLTKMRGDQYVPMNLLWHRRPIIDPLPDVCDVPKQLVDWKKAEVIRTRPRVYGSSAVSIDDVEDPEVRNLLLAYMYTTDAKRAMKEAQDYIHQQNKNSDPQSKECEDVAKVPTPCVIKDEGVTTWVPSIIPPIHRDVSKGFEAWDNRQMRATVDPTVNYWTRFYQNRTPDKPLTSYIPTETIDLLTDLVETDQLRFPHDKGPCGYAGYMPEITTIGVRKIELPMEHPMHTTNDTVYVNHYDHANNNYEK